MSRYVDAEAAKKDADERGMAFFLNLTDVDEMKRFLDNQPTADVEKVRHGEWIALANGNMKHWKEKCSCCGAIGRGRPPYCRECGAKMDGNK